MDVPQNNCGFSTSIIGLFINLIKKCPIFNDLFYVKDEACQSGIFNIKFNIKRPGRWLHIRLFFLWILEHTRSSKYFTKFYLIENLQLILMDSLLSTAFTKKHDFIIQTNLLSNRMFIKSVGFQILLNKHRTIFCVIWLVLDVLENILLLFCWQWEKNKIIFN